LRTVLHQRRHNLHIRKPNIFSPLHVSPLLSLLNSPSFISAGENRYFQSWPGPSFNVEPTALITSRLDNVAPSPIWLIPRQLSSYKYLIWLHTSRVEKNTGLGMISTRWHIKNLHVQAHKSNVHERFII